MNLIKIIIAITLFLSCTKKEPNRWGLQFVEFEKEFILKENDQILSFPLKPRMSSRFQMILYFDSIDGNSNDLILGNLKDEIIKSLDGFTVIVRDKNRDIILHSHEINHSNHTGYSFANNQYTFMWIPFTDLKKNSELEVSISIPKLDEEHVVKSFILVIGKGGKSYL